MDELRRARCDSVGSRSGDRKVACSSADWAFHNEIFKSWLTIALQRPVCSIVAATTLDGQSKLGEICPPSVEDKSRAVPSAYPARQSVLSSDSVRHCRSRRLE